jgi:hypothetical protein
MHTAVWTGDDMIVFGGFDGTVEVADGSAWDGAAWTPLPANPELAARYRHTATWLADAAVMVVFGGSTAANLGADDGSVYDPTSGWTKAVVTAIEGRFEHTAVSTGTRVIVWGGLNAASTALASGGIYDPAK